MRIIIHDASQVIAEAVRDERKHSPTLTFPLRNLRVPGERQELEGQPSWKVEMHALFEAIRDRSVDAFWYWLEFYLKHRRDEATHFTVKPEMVAEG